MDEWSNEEEDDQPNLHISTIDDEDILISRVQEALTWSQPFQGDEMPVDKPSSCLYLDTTHFLHLL